MHYGRFASASPSNQRIEVGIERQACRLFATTHVACVVDFNRLDEMLWRVKRLKACTLVATPYRDLLPIQQSKTQTF